MSLNFEKQLASWNEKEKLAAELIGITADLWYDKAIELVIFRRKLVDQGVNAILKLQKRASEIIHDDLSIQDIVEIARILQSLELAPSKLDLGKLGHEWMKSNLPKDEFIKDTLKGFIGEEKIKLEPKDVVLFGFGRIGRLATRILVNQTGKGRQLRLRGIVIRRVDDQQIAKRAELLRTDSVHGPFKGTIEEDFKNKALIINGQPVYFIEGGNPAEIDYTEYGINNALLIDNSGAFRDREGLSNHLNAKGIAKVLLTAPGKGDLQNIVHGVNHQSQDENEKIFSAASCTTNAIVPTLKLIDDHFGIAYGHIETVHSFTNDQNLIDNYHNKYRRGRSAALNLVITETGAGKAVGKALPHLNGKLSGNAVRVPTPDGSLAILNLSLNKPTSKEEVNAVLKNESLYGDLTEQLEFSENEELVSTDIIGNPHASIVDGAATIAGSDPKNIILYVWYDNEYGYTEQVIRLAKYIAGVRRLTYY